MVFRQVLLLLLLGIGGCAPVLSQSLLDSSEPRIPFNEIKAAPDRHVGKTVVLGGTLIRVIRANDHPIMEILERPLGSRLQPQGNDKTGGRFLARFDKLNEESDLQKGRLITFGGTVVGQETRPLDRTEYTYPVIQVEEYYLWREQGEGPGAPPISWSIGVSGTL